MEDNDFYNAFIWACIIGIILTIAFIVWMKGVINEREQFNELYFNQHRELPKEMELNKTYSISFTVSNHELRGNNYIYEIVSDIKTQKHNFSLLPEETAIFSVQVTPTNRTWNTHTEIQKHVNFTLDATNLAIYNLPELQIINTTITHTSLSHNLSGLGEIYHTNLSIEELGEKPFTKMSNQYQYTNNISTNTTTKTILSILDNTLFYERSESKTIDTNFERKPFLVNVYKQNAEKGDEYSVYFWYELL